jgi:hypothetical protein
MTVIGNSCDTPLLCYVMIGSLTSQLLPLLPRCCKQPLSRRFGRMFLAVGAVAGAYHSTSGTARTALRVADYWSIAWSTCVLRKAVFSCHLQPTPAASAAAAGTPLAHSAPASVASAVAAIAQQRLPAAAHQLLQPVLPYSPSLTSAAGRAGRGSWHSVLSRVLQGTCLAAIPFKPTLVTAVNLVLVEVRCLRCTSCPATEAVYAMHAVDVPGACFT